MKKIVFLSILGFLSTEITAQVKWEYPITPGSDAWRSFTTSREMVDVCQIPEATLENMTTAELLQAWENFPLKLDVIAFNSPQKGFEVQKEISDALKWLLKKADAGEVVFRRYQEAKAAEAQIYSKQHPEISINDYWMLKLLVSQPEILSKISDVKARSVLERELRHPGSLMKVSSSLDIRTPRGTSVPNTVRSDGADDPWDSWVFDVDEVDEYYRTHYPQATIVSSSTRTYNCHSYAWANGYTNRCWINTPSDDLYFQEPAGDGSYDELSESVATKVSYSGDHSATTTATANVYISKWGQAPRMQHNKNYVPAGYGSPNKFWRRSVDVPLDQSSINSAISAAVSGQTVQVCPGSYTLTGDISLLSGRTLSLLSGATVNLNGYSIIMSGGTLNKQTGSTISGLRAYLKNGSTIKRYCGLIQSACTNASNGYTVEVQSGTFTENITVASKSNLTITGMGASSTTLNGDVTLNYVSNNTLKLINVRGDIVVNGGTGNWVRDAYHRDYLEFNYGSGYHVYNSTHYQPSSANSWLTVHQCDLYADRYYSTNTLPSYGVYCGEADMTLVYGEIKYKDTGFRATYYATAEVYENVFCNNSPWDFWVEGGCTVWAGGDFSDLPVPWTGGGTLNIPYSSDCSLGKSTLAEDATHDPQSADEKAYGEIRTAYGEINKQIQEAVLMDEEVTGRFDAEFRLVAGKLKQFIADFPESPHARSAGRLLSFVLERQGNPEQFIDYAGAQLKQARNPELTNGLMAGLVHAYVGSGDFEKAVETSDALANMGVPLTQKESALYGKGVIHQYFLGDKQSAEEAYDRVLNLNPNSGWADAIAKHRQRDAIRVESQPGVRPRVQQDTQEEFGLSNYPNPGNPSTALSYHIPQAGKVRIRVFDVLGRLVKTLVDENQEASQHTIVWNGRDDRGIASASGIYFCKMQFNGRTLTTKMTLVR